MRSPALALAWQLWRPHRWALSAIVAGMAILAVVCRVLPVRQMVDGVSGLVGLLLCVAYVYLLSVSVYSGSLTESRKGGFPSWMFTLPVPTSLLVAWPMLFGMAAAALLWLATAQFVLVPLGVANTVAWWPALLFATSVACFQAIAWTLVGAPLVRLVVAILILPGLTLSIYYAGLFRPGAGLFPFSYGELAVGLVCLILIAYAVAVAGVALDRRGSGLHSLPWRRLLEGLINRLPRRQPSLTSPARAQLWLEWRQKGLLLPFVLGCFMLTMLVTVPITQFDPPDVLNVFAETTILAFTLAFFVGFGMGKTSFWAKDMGLSQFNATRPLSSYALAAAKLRMAALSAAVTWALVVLLMALWVVLTGSGGTVAGWWEALFRAHPPLKAWALVVLAATGAVALTWMQLVGGLGLALTGRAWVVNGFTGLQLAAAAGLIFLGTWTWHHPNFYDTLLVLLWCLAGLAALGKGLAAAWVIRATLRRELQDGAGLWKLLGVWLAIAAGLVTLTYLLMPPGQGPVHLIALGAVLALPLARLLAAPLALAWNRHR
jgi:hypothetical protein